MGSKEAMSDSEMFIGESPAIDEILFTLCQGSSRP